LAGNPVVNGRNKYDVLRKILEKHRVIHVVDPYRRAPVWYEEIIYFRLHGIGPRETNYKYKYTDKDLRYLLDKIREYGARVFYVMFNNIYMYDDALRFKNILENNNIHVIVIKACIPRRSLPMRGNTYFVPRRGSCASSVRREIIIIVKLYYNYMVVSE